jgi:hypothetical protein
MNLQCLPSQTVPIDRLLLLNVPHRFTIEELAILLYDLYSATDNVLQGYVIYIDEDCNIVIRSRKLEDPIIIHFHEALIWSIAHLPSPLPRLENINHTLNTCFGEESELRHHFPTLPSTSQFVKIGMVAYKNMWINPLELPCSIDSEIP